MGKRLLPYRVFPRGTSTKMMRFWVTTEEHSAMVQAALEAEPGGSSMSRMVVDRVLSEDAPMTSGEARTAISAMFSLRDEIGRCALALRASGAPQDQVDAALADLAEARVRLYNLTEDLAQ